MMTTSCCIGQVRVNSKPGESPESALRRIHVGGFGKSSLGTLRILKYFARPQCPAGVSWRSPESDRAAAAQFCSDAPHHIVFPFANRICVGSAMCFRMSVLRLRAHLPGCHTDAFAPDGDPDARSLSEIVGVIAIFMVLPMTALSGQRTCCTGSGICTPWSERSHCWFRSARVSA